MVDLKARHHLFTRALQRADWTVQQLWLATIASGGTVSVMDLEAFLYGLNTLPSTQQDVLASALNQRLADQYRSATIPYLTTPGPSGPPAEDPLAVLNEYLQATHDTTQHPRLPPT